MFVQHDDARFVDRAHVIVLFAPAQSGTIPPIKLSAHKVFENGDDASSRERAYGAVDARHGFFMVLNQVGSI